MRDGGYNRGSLPGKAGGESQVSRTADEGVFLSVTCVFSEGKTLDNHLTSYQLLHPLGSTIINCKGTSIVNIP